MAIETGRQAARARGRATVRREGGDSRPRKALTIGAVAKILGQEFKDISISKIRYLEDQKLLTPRRTPGGYRLYSQADVERLRAILRMQRDEFLPLRVIRQELATGDFTGRRPSGESQKRRAASVGEPRYRPSPARSCSSRPESASSSCASCRSSGSSSPSAAAATPLSTRPTSRSSAPPTSCSKFGVAGRNLRVFRTSADREAALLEQLLGAQLRSRSQARRKEAVENLESLAAVCGHLKHLLLVRDLRRLKAPRSSAGRADAEGHAKPGDRRPRRSGSGTWSPTRTTCPDGGRGRPRRGRARPRRQARPLDRGARDRARHRRPRRLPLHRRDRGRALRVGAGDRRNPVREDPQVVDGRAQDPARPTTAPR